MFVFAKKEKWTRKKVGGGFNASLRLPTRDRGLAFWKEGIGGPPPNFSFGNKSGKKTKNEGGSGRFGGGNDE